jgi:hypothetical protein
VFGGFLTTCALVNPSTLSMECGGPLHGWVEVLFLGI